jgi:hypothetical protein
VARSEYCDRACYVYRARRAKSRSHLASAARAGRLDRRQCTFCPTNCARGCDFRGVRPETQKQYRYIYLSRDEEGLWCVARVGAQSPFGMQDCERCFHRAIDTLLSILALLSLARISATMTRRGLRQLASSQTRIDHESTPAFRAFPDLTRSPSRSRFFR